ncbi:hypothetical protein EON65_11330 [archaeon]|nr:MAG: hypothetical protein EON65_11330 [archaeon]
MPIIVLSSRDIGPSVPSSIQSSITQEQWNNIFGRLGSLQTQSHSMACLIEFGVCLFFAFPCIFLCHACIAQAMVSGRWDT